MALRKFVQGYVVTYFENIEHVFTSYIMTTIGSKRATNVCLFNYQSQTTSYLQMFSWRLVAVQRSSHHDAATQEQIKYKLCSSCRFSF